METNLITSGSQKPFANIIFVRHETVELALAESCFLTRRECVGGRFFFLLLNIVFEEISDSQC
jgi:hypothetical protein